MTASTPSKPAPDKGQISGNREMRVPRPDCAIWNDIARALGTGTGRDK